MDAKIQTKLFMDSEIIRRSEKLEGDDTGSEGRQASPSFRETILPGMGAVVREGANQ